MGRRLRRHIWHLCAEGQRKANRSLDGLVSIDDTLQGTRGASIPEALQTPGQRCLGVLWFSVQEALLGRELPRWSTPSSGPGLGAPVLAVMMLCTAHEYFS